MTGRVILREGTAGDDMKKFVSADMIETARKMDLLTYLRLYEPDELVRLSDNVYCTRSHDSLKISNGAWMWWSTGIGGYTAIDYLIKVRGLPFIEAVERICDHRERLPPQAERDPDKPNNTTKPLLLPQRADNNFTAIQYLCSRGIEKRIAVECSERGLFYESLPYHNIIFVGFDKENKPRYAGYRATNGQRILGECSGSDKHYSFRLVGAECDAVHLFESAIDLLSFATLLKLAGEDYHRHNMVSLAGIYAPSKDTGKASVPAVLLSYLDEHPSTRKVFIHFDNDIKGRQAAQVIVNKLSDRYKVVDFPPPCGKDFNDFLLLHRQNQLRLSHRKER